MVEPARLAEYLAAIRQHVCSRCIDRPPGGPPCGPQGKCCGVEVHLEEIVEVAHSSRSKAIDPFIERFHEDICTHCANRSTAQCPCPLDPLLLLAIEAIDMVDERRITRRVDVAEPGTPPRRRFTNPLPIISNS